MILIKTNGSSIDVAIEDIREYWDFPNEDYRKVTVSIDDSTTITYNVLNELVEIEAAVNALLEEV